MLLAGQHVLTADSLLHPFLHHQISQAPPETEVRPDGRFFPRYHHDGYQLRPLYDLHGLRLRPGRQ